MPRTRAGQSMKLRIPAGAVLERRSYVISDPYEPGLNAAMTLAPPGPSQTPTLNGMPTADPQESFCVEKPRMPMCARRAGNDAGNPNVSGSITSALERPSSRRNHREP